MRPLIETAYTTIQTQAQETWLVVLFLVTLFPVRQTIPYARLGKQVARVRGI